MEKDDAPPTATKRWATVSPREQIRRRYFSEMVLITHEGRKVRLYEDLIKDKIVLLNFMYARCQGVCSPVTSNLVKVQALLRERVGRDIFMYSFSLKPDEDTPEVLGEYARAHGVGPGWTFLTGDPSDLEALRRRLGFTDPDPARDADRTNHTGMVRFGNEPLQLWAAFAGMSKPESIAHEILWVDRPHDHAQGPEAIKKG